jgi:hypothetical protein
LTRFYARISHDRSAAGPRSETLKRHMALEITHEWGAFFATFERPRYELNGSDVVFNGQEAVRSCFASSHAPFSDQGN